MMDNYFTSPELSEYLKTQNIHVRHYVQIEADYRSWPLTRTLREVNLIRVSDQGISFFKWKYHRPVHFLSNYHRTEVTSHVYPKKWDKIDVPAPSIVKDKTTWKEWTRLTC
jgi:hypothetical protein